MLLTTEAGRTFYIAPGGNDSADGSTRHPWATIQHAANAVAAGDTVHVAAGSTGRRRHQDQRGSNPSHSVHLGLFPGVQDHEPAEYAWYNTGNYVDIQGFKFSGNSQVAIECEASYTRIIGNHVYGNQNGSCSQGGAGIDVGNYPASGNVGITTGNQIIGNVVNNCGVPGVKSSTQGHGIYISDTGPIVQNNIVYNNSGIGITGWHACTNATISNNLVWGNLDCGIEIGAGDAPGGVICNNSVVFNNISINNGNFGIQEYGSVCAKTSSSTIASTETAWLRPVSS